MLRWAIVFLVIALIMAAAALGMAEHYTWRWAGFVVAFFFVLALASFTSALKGRFDRTVSEDDPRIPAGTTARPRSSIMADTEIPGGPPLHRPPKVEQSDHVRIVTFTADKVRDVENVIARELEGQTEGLARSHLLLDFMNVERLGSVELETLIALHMRMKACGGRLTLFNLSAPVYETFTATHLQTLLGICREGTAGPGGGSTTLIKQEAGAPGKAGVGDPDKFVGSE